MRSVKNTSPTCPGIGIDTDSNLKSLSMITWEITRFNRLSNSTKPKHSLAVLISVIRGVTCGRAGISTQNNFLGVKWQAEIIQHKRKHGVSKYDNLGTFNLSAIGMDTCPSKWCLWWMETTAFFSSALSHAMLQSRVNKSEMYSLLNWSMSTLSAFHIPVSFYIFKSAFCFAFYHWCVAVGMSLTWKCKEK